jgi:hypothetical protein
MPVLWYCLGLTQTSRKTTAMCRKPPHHESALSHWAFMLGATRTALAAPSSAPSIGQFWQGTRPPWHTDRWIWTRTDRHAGCCEQATAIEGQLGQRRRAPPLKRQCRENFREKRVIFSSCYFLRQWLILSSCSSREIRLVSPGRSSVRPEAGEPDAHADPSSPWWPSSYSSNSTEHQT